MQPQIFLSYCRTDAAVAEAFYNAATARNLNVWWDRLIPVGRDWRESIVEALNRSAVLLILFSAASNKSSQLIKELSIADRQKKLVIPVLIDNAEPEGAYLYEMASRNWINLYPDPTSRVKALVDRLADHVGVKPKKSAPVLAAAVTPPVAAAQRSPQRPPSAAPMPIQSKGVDAAVGRRSPRELPIKAIDFCILLPLLWLIFSLGVSGAFGGGRGNPAPALNMLLLIIYMFVVAIRSARLNISIFSVTSFVIYLCIGLLILPSALLIDWLLGVKGDYFSLAMALTTMCVIAAACANVLQFVLRKVFQRNIFRTQIREPLEARQSARDSAGRGGVREQAKGADNLVGPGLRA